MRANEIPGKIIGFFTRNPVLLLIIVIAVLIRLYDLSSESFWIDEAMTGLRCRWEYSVMIDNIAGKDHLPFYFSFMWIFSKLFGTSEFFIRLPSAIFGVLAVIPTYYLAKGISRRAGYISALIMAIHPTMIYFSQEARMYSLVFLLSASSLYFMKMFLNETGKKRRIYIGAFLATNLIFVYTHYFGLLFVGVECISIFLISIMRRNNSLKRRIVEFLRDIWPGLASMLLFLPWFIYIQLNYPFSGHKTGGGLTLSKDLIFFMYLFLGGNYHFHYDPISGITYLLSVLLVLLAITGAVVLLIRSKKDEKVREDLSILLPVVILPPIMVYIVSKIWQPIFNYRYMIFMGAPFIILAAIPLSDPMLLKKLKVQYWKKIKFACILFIVILIMGTNYGMFEREDKDDWRGAVNYILENQGDNDLVLPQPAHYRYPIYYYTRDLNVRSISDSSKNVSDLLDNYDTVWVITFHYRDIDRYGFTEFLSDRYHEDVDDFNGLMVRRYWRI